jgi:hypothetical protein
MKVKRDLKNQKKFKILKDWERKLKEDGAFRFWDSYFSAEIFKREKLLNPIIKRFRELAKIKDFPEDRLNDLYELALISYLDDIENYFSIKEGFK